jgi:predicted nucleic-acid-binding Zn-ribbon protein
MRNTHQCPKCAGTRILSTDVGIPLVGITQLIRATAFACAKCGYVEQYVRGELGGLWKEIPPAAVPAKPLP